MQLGLYASEFTHSVLSIGEGAGPGQDSQIADGMAPMLIAHQSYHRPHHTESGDLCLLQSGTVLIVLHQIKRTDCAIVCLSVCLFDGCVRPFFDLFIDSMRSSPFLFLETSSALFHSILSSD